MHVLQKFWPCSCTFLWNVCSASLLVLGSWMSTRSPSRLTAMKGLAFFLAGAMSMTVVLPLAATPLLLTVTQLDEAWEVAEGVMARVLAVADEDAAAKGLVRRGSSLMLDVLAGWTEGGVVRPLRPGGAEEVLMVVGIRNGAWGKSSDRKMPGKLVIPKPRER